MRQLSRAEALKVSKVIESRMTATQIAAFQLRQDRVVASMSTIHKAINLAVGHPVFTHELGSGPKLEALYNEVRVRHSAETEPEVLEAIVESILKER